MDDESETCGSPEPNADNAPEDPHAGDQTGNEDSDGEFSVDDLGAAYAEAMAEAGLLPDPPPAAAAEEDESEQQHPDASSGETLPPPTPEGIVEAALFLGHPENKPLSARELALVMRDVSPSEIDEIVSRLNETYEQQDHAFRIVQEPAGYRLVLSPQVDAVRRVFYGKIREARLSQPAIEILALVAYQPGISSHELTRLRGKDCGALLNQLVRRRLLDVTREVPEGGGRRIMTYRPTDRFLNLFGLSNLDDLPQVDDSVSSIY